MPFSLLPKAIFYRLTDVTPAFLQDRGIDLLMLDFDNTMLPYTSRVPAPELLTWLDGMERNSALCGLQQQEGQGRRFLPGAQHFLRHPLQKANRQGHPPLPCPI